jgi:MFS family permease
MTPATGTRDAAAADLHAVQRRTVRVLVAGQVLGGIGVGATLAVGAVMAAEISGSQALSGTAATFTTLGAAATAIPLARFAQRRGRRPALATGAVLASSGSVLTITAAALGFFPLLLLAFALLGAGVAVNLQSRFAATDIASDRHRGRDLSLVVWSTTIGAVLGPNLIGPGEAIAATLRMPPLTGSFLIALSAQLAAAAVYLIWLRPDPYRLSRHTPQQKPVDDGGAGAVRGRRTLIFAIGSIALSHAVMVSVMSMTPVHLVHHGVTLALVGLTISLHVAGMYALSPVFGWLSDRLGGIHTVLTGQGLFAVALPLVALGEADPAQVTAGLVFLGLGWSASTVGGSALVAGLATGAARPRIQGRTDLAMNLAGAGGGAAAGLVLALIGYAGLAWSAGALVLLVVVGSAMTRRGTEAGTVPA